MINSIIFEGNKKIKSSVLITIITLKTRGVLTDAKLQTDISRIKDYYATNGRSEAYVTAKITDLGDNRVDVRLPHRRRRQDRRRRHHVRRQQLLLVLAPEPRDPHAPDQLAELAEPQGHLQRRQARADEDALRTFYLSHGYADFQVLDAHADFDEAKGKYYVTFTLDEGAKYKYGDISVDSSIPGVDSSHAQQARCAPRAARRSIRREVEKTVEDLTVELSRLGYVFAVVSPRGDRDYTNHIITITYIIDEGPRAYIERIEIRGNTKTRDYVIRREFEIVEGDAYNRVLIDKAQRNLRALGYFKTVDITTHQGSAPDKVVVIVDVAGTVDGIVLGGCRRVEHAGRGGGGIAGGDQLPRPRSAPAGSRSAAARPTERSTSRSPTRISSAITCRPGFNIYRNTSTPIIACGRWARRRRVVGCPGRSAAHRHDVSCR